MSGADPTPRHRTGGVVRLADLAPHTGLVGHPGLTAFRFVRPPSDLARWLLVTLDVVEHGGGIDPHVHEGLDADHAYYVMSGEVLAQIGDERHEVGADSLMIFPCDTLHGFEVTSPGGARILRLGAAPDGRASGGSVFS